MTPQKRSTWTFIILLAILAAATALNSFLPQGSIATLVPASTMPVWQQALGGAAITAALYGLLGFLGLILWRALGFPEVWESAVTNRMRFLIPVQVSLALGAVLILLDLAFARLNGVGQLMHPPFPTSLVASVGAGIGEEMIFRLFFVSFWTWLVGKVILRGRGLGVVFGVVSALSAVASAASHFPTLMILLGVSDPSGFSPVLLLQVFLLNGLIAVIAAYAMRKAGFLAAVGIHFWTDVVWHVIWGLF